MFRKYQSRLAIITTLIIFLFVNSTMRNFLVFSLLLLSQTSPGQMLYKQDTMAGGVTHLWADRIDYGQTTKMDDDNNVITEGSNIYVWNVKMNIGDKKIEIRCDSAAHHDHMYYCQNPKILDGKSMYAADNMTYNSPPRTAVSNGTIFSGKDILPVRTLVLDFSGDRIKVKSDHY